MNNRLIYTSAEGVVCVVLPAPKEDVELILGPLTQEEYIAHIEEVSISPGASNIRWASVKELPADREFRKAWVDLEGSSHINIDVTKAKEDRLAALRVDRNERLKALDAETLKALDTGVGLEAVKAKKQILRDATEPLKALQTDGKVDDEELLAEIKRLSVLPA